MINFFSKTKALVLFLFTINILQAKTLIISAAYNRPDLIELQSRCIRKFVLGEVDHIIFNDAEEPRFISKIESECSRLGIRHIRVPQEEVHKNHQASNSSWHDVFDFKSSSGERLPYRVNFREGEMIQFAFDQVGFDYDGVVVNMDLDCFPIREIDFKKKMDGHLIAGYKWNMPPFIADTMLPILMVFDMANLPHKKALNFNSAFIGSQWVDLCALLQFYVYCHDIKIKDLVSLGHVHCSKLGQCYSSDQLKNMEYSESTISFVKDYYKKLFLELGYKPFGVSCNGSDELGHNKNAKLIHDLGQIMDRDFFHFNQCTNWMGAYDDKFMKAKTKLVREFVFSIT